MELPGSFGLFAVGLLVLANGFFVATEFAIVAVRRSRLGQLAASGQASARAAQDVVSHLDTYIAACQLGITMASLALGWIGEPAFSNLVEPPVERLAGPFAHEAAQGLSAAISFGLITTLHIVLGELAPKGLALQRTEATALMVARPMQLFHSIFRWPIAALNGIGNSILRLVGLEPSTGHEMVHSVEELRLLVTGMEQAGVVEPSEARIAARAFHFGDLPAGELMTPRTEVEAVPITSTLAELLKRAATSIHSRWLAYDGSLDNIVGVLPVRSLFRLLGEPPEAFRLQPLLRPALFAPASKAADDLLDELRSSRQQLAVLLDEYGGTAGIITLEDLLEALVGHIDEESSVETPPYPTSAGGPELDGSLVLDGLTRLSELQELVGVHLGAETREVDTLGGLVMYRLGRIASLGDEIRLDGWLVRVEELNGRRAARLRLVPATAA